MSNYYRIMLGPQSMYADDAYRDGYIGAGWLENIDLTNNLTEVWQDFNKKYIPIYLQNNPGKSRVSAGLACGMLHTIAKGILIGDIILSPNGRGEYYVGEVVGDYEFISGHNLPHRRKVKWYENTISRERMSQPLKNSTGSISTVCNITSHQQEIMSLISEISNNGPIQILTNDETIENPTLFALEKHLEDFLVHNWSNTELGNNYKIFSDDDGEIIGQQYQTDTGPIDILAISNDNSELLVVELKRGRVSDVVVGQIQRYMGYVKDVLAEENQTVKGIIIGSEYDNRLQRALSVAPNIDFYTYNLRFNLDQPE